MPPVPFWARPSGVALILASYFLAHFAVRMWMAPTLGVDDAEQALFAQHWLANYRFRAPPLFTWMLMALGEVMPIDRLPIAIIRYLLLGVTAAFLYLTARRLIADERLAALSVYSLGAIYVFAWYSHHDLTHTTALAAGLAGSWYAFVRLAERPALGWYLALGAAIGLAALGKWNAVLFAAALPLACLALPRYRPLVLDWRIVPAMLVAGAIVALPVLHALRTGPAAGDATGELLGEDKGFLAGILSGSADLLVALLAYPQPFLVIAVAIFGSALLRAVRGPSLPAPRPGLDLVLVVMALVAALHFALVLFAGATEFSERMMQPALIILPVAFFMIVERGGVSARAVRLYAILLVVLTVGVLAGRIGLHAAGGDYCRGSCRALQPYQTIAGEFRRAGFTGYGTVLAQDFHIGGNLRVLFPDARVMTPDYPPATWPEAQAGGQCLLVWRGDDAMPDDLSDYLVVDLAVPAGTPPLRRGVVSAPLIGGKTRGFSLNYALYDVAGSECR